MNLQAQGLEIVVATLLALAVAAAGTRMLWRFLRMPEPRRPRSWRLATLLLVQAVGAFLLYRTLFPPPVHAPAGLLVVATAAADRVPARERPPGARVVAMPEAPALTGASRMPDLATALRRHPGTTRVRVLGAGLAARDLEAARGLAVEFRPAPLPRGLVALWPPPGVQAGRRFEVGGRANGLDGGQVELLDPAQRIVAHARPDDGGRFRLTAVARTPGPATWTLRLRDHGGTAIEDATLPLDVAPGAPLRVLFLAGAPNAELKYLRRWASDSGLALDTRIELGAGMQIGDAPVRFDAARLAGYDLVVLDARSWQGLGARRGPLLEAVRGGLGLLLRLPHASSAGDRAALRRLGFEAASARARSVRMSSGDEAPTLTRGSLRITGDDAVPMLADAGGAALAWWRARGLGRIGIVGFDDSHRWVLAGDGARHGDLWAGLFSTIARPRAAPSAQVPDSARAGERMTLCALPADATVEAPDGRRTPLYIDPVDSERACAGFWPRISGWHLLRAGDAVQRFNVRAADAVPGLRAARLQDDTARLAAATATADAGQGPARPGPRWPWFLAWLALATAGWWLERSRAGTAAASGRG